MITNVIDQLKRDEGFRPTVYDDSRGFGLGMNRGWRLDIVSYGLLRRIASLGAKVAKETGQAATIAHIRWHVNRGVVKPDCGLCV